MEIVFGNSELARQYVSSNDTAHLFSSITPGVTDPSNWTYIENPEDAVLTWSKESVSASACTLFLHNDTPAPTSFPNVLTGLELNSALLEYLLVLRYALATALIRVPKQFQLNVVCEFPQKCLWTTVVEQAGPAICSAYFGGVGVPISVRFFKGDAVRASRLFPQLKGSTDES